MWQGVAILLAHEHGCQTEDMGDQQRLQSVPKFGFGKCREHKFWTFSFILIGFPAFLIDEDLHLGHTTPK